MTKKYITIVWHVLGCLAFLVIPVFLSPRPPGMPLLSPATMRDFLADGLMLIIFYLNFYLLIPRVYFRGKTFWYGMLILLGFLTITLLPSLMTGYVPWDPPTQMQRGMRPPIDSHSISAVPAAMPPARSDASFLTQVKHNIFLYIAVILFSILLRVRMKLFDTEVLKFKAEMSTLRNQINPHFLFNTLNNIYALAIREKSPTTASTILKLSGMMRYVVTETRHEFVPLEREINYTNDYIDLQKLRLTKNMNLSYRVTGVVRDQEIAPLVLMPFIENAFKHGVNPDQDSFINIHIDVNESFVELNVENQKLKIDYEQHAKSGVGIENTRARLESLYGRNYTLAVHEDPLHYRIKLTIRLT